MKGCLLLLVILSSVVLGCSASLTQNEDGKVKILDLSILPKLDEVEKKDTAASSSLSSLKTKSTHSATGSTSSTGCMGLHFFKPEAINRVRQAELYKCYAAATQDSLPGMTIPQDRFAYYLVKLKNKSILFRLKNEVSSSSTALHMDVCESSDGVTFKRATEFTTSGDLSTAAWTGSIINHVQGGFDCTNYTMVMTSAAVMDEEFDFNNVNSIETSSCYCQNPSTSDVESSTSCGAVFTLGFAYDGAGRNKTIGAYSVPSSNVTGKICTEFNEVEGAGTMTYDLTGSYYYSDTEGFNVSTSPTVIPISEVDFFSEYSCGTLPDEAQEARVLSDVTFTRSWDCTLPPGQLPVKVEYSLIDYSACDSLATKISGTSRVSSSECFKDQGISVSDEGSSTSGGSPVTSDPTDNGSGGGGGTGVACGNGTQETGEQCDDGNTTSGDGCSATCQTETVTQTVSLPNSWTTDSSTVASHTCDSAPPNTNVAGWIVTKNSESSSEFTATVTTPGGNITETGTKTNNVWTLTSPDSDAIPEQSSGCTYQMANAMSGTLSSFSCTTMNKTYTQQTGDCDFIPVSGSCTATINYTCTAQ